MEVRQLRSHSSRRRNARLIRDGSLRLLVFVVAEDETEQQSWHDNVPKAEHGKVAGIVQTRKDQLAGQIQFRRLLHHQIQLLSHQADRIVRGPGRYLNHDISTEYVRRKEDPEDVVDQQSGQQQRGNLEARQAHKGYEGHAQAHSHGVHQQPMACQHPNTDDRHGQGETEEFSGRKAPADAERNAVTIRAGSYDVLAHGQQEEGKGHGRRYGGTHGKEHLHRVEEEEHDQQGNGGAQGQTECVHSVKGRKLIRLFRLDVRLPRQQIQ